MADASPLNFDSAELKGAITPESIQALPLLVSGAVRSSAAFITLQPGVNTGGSANPFNARVNGGLQSGDEAVLDGVSMQQGLLNQSGMVSIYTDFPVSPRECGRSEHFNFELRTAVWFDHFIGDHGHHQVGDERIPRRRL